MIGISRKDTRYMISGKNAITNITTVLGSCRMLIIKALLMVPMIVLSNLASTGNTYSVVQITSTAAAMIRITSTLLNCIPDLVIM